jgi:hypothetical protein
MIARWGRWVRRFFERREPFAWSETFARQREAFARAGTLVRCYYGALLFLAVLLLPEWPGLLQHRSVVPLWPVAWLLRVELPAGIVVILALHLAGSLAGALWPERRGARALAFVGWLQYVALINSFGKINHSLHLWVLTAFLLVFLPRRWGKHKTLSRTQRQQFLLVFWSCQAVTLLVYSMAGLGKILGAIYQMAMGQAHAFQPDALAILTADRLLQTNVRGLFSEWLIAHPWFGWPLMLADLYLQFFSFWAAFRPALQRLWAVLLILFHVGVFLLMTIVFPQNVLLLAVLFISSAADLPRALVALPLFGIFFKKAFSFFSRQRIPV